MMQAASNEAADKVERAFLQTLLMSLNSNNKEVSVRFVVLEVLQLWDRVGLKLKSKLFVFSFSLSLPSCFTL
jgi:hypothetical protein